MIKCILYYKLTIGMEKIVVLE